MRENEDIVRYFSKNRKVFNDTVVSTVGADRNPKIIRRTRDERLLSLFKKSHSASARNAGREGDRLEKRGPAKSVAGSGKARIGNTRPFLQDRYGRRWSRPTASHVVQARFKGKYMRSGD
jgi:hypothetical protein